jgi:hypothetical protein
MSYYGMEREWALVMAYDSCKDSLDCNLDEEQFALAFDGWEIVPVMDGEEIIGCVMILGRELHVGIYKTPSSSPLRFIKKTLNRVIEEHSVAVTTIRSSNKRGLLFCKRLGFIVTGGPDEEGNIALACYRSNFK